MTRPDFSSLTHEQASFMGEVLGAAAIRFQHMSDSYRAENDLLLVSEYALKSKRAMIWREAVLEREFAARVEEAVRRAA